MRIITLTQVALAGDMFDGILETQTETADAIVTTFPVDGFNAVTLLNNFGVGATLEIGGVTQTVSLIRDGIKDWWDYWFAPTRTGKDVVFYFPEQSAGVEATVTISYPGGTAKCGMCVTGLAKQIATTLEGASVGISDYSRIATNEFGQTYLKQGKWAKRAEVDLRMSNTLTDIAYREVVKNRASACIFDYNEYTEDLDERHTSENGLQALINYGYTEDLHITRPGLTNSVSKHESQGLI